MAIYHCRVHMITRSKGQTAIQAAAYRSGTKLYDEETGLTADYTRKHGISYSEIMLPNHAPKEYSDRQTLWNAVQKVENKRDSQLAREFELALPVEWEPQNRVRYLKEFLQPLVDTGMIIDFSIHNSPKNPHAHVMATTRGIKPDGSWAAKEKKAYSLDSSGNRIPIIDSKTGKQKVGKNGRREWKRETVRANDWNSHMRINEWRKSWADVCNSHLAADQQISHLSYEKQGVERVPTIHEGYIARKIERRSEISERCQTNRDISSANQTLLALKSFTVETAEELNNIRERQERQHHDYRANTTLAANARPDPTPAGNHPFSGTGVARSTTNHINVHSQKQRTASISESIERRKRKIAEYEDRLRAAKSRPDPTVYSPHSEDIANMDEQYRRYQNADGQIVSEIRPESCRIIVSRIKQLDKELGYIDTSNLDRIIAASKARIPQKTETDLKVEATIREIQMGFRSISYIEKSQLTLLPELQHRLEMISRLMQESQNSLNENTLALEKIKGLIDTYNHLIQLKPASTKLSGRMEDLKAQIDIERKRDQLTRTLRAVGLNSREDVVALADKYKELSQRNAGLQTQIVPLHREFERCNEAYRYLAKLMGETPVSIKMTTPISQAERKATQNRTNHDRSSR